MSTKDADSVDEVEIPTNMGQLKNFKATRTLESLVPTTPLPDEVASEPPRSEVSSLEKEERGQVKAATWRPVKRYLTARRKRKKEKLMKKRNRETSVGSSDNLLPSMGNLPITEVQSLKHGSPKAKTRDRKHSPSIDKGSRIRSNSTTHRRGKKQRKKQQQEEREFRIQLSQNMRETLKKLIASMADEDKGSFCECFRRDKPLICSPVGILKETDVSRYFDNFISVVQSYDVEVLEGSVIATPIPVRASLHCEVLVETRYNEGKEATRFRDPQHWHFDFEVEENREDSDLELISRTPKQENRKKAKQNKVIAKDMKEIKKIMSGDFEQKEWDDEGKIGASKGNVMESGMSIKTIRKPNYVIRRWNIYSSQSKVQKLTDRTFSDTLSGINNWAKLTQTYGLSFTKSSLVDAFSTEKIPKEVDLFIQSLNTLDHNHLLKALSPSSQIVVFGIFHMVYDKKNWK